VFRISAALITALLVLVPSSLLAGTISRSTKRDGGTEWVTGEVLTAARLNGDINAVVNEFNGQIESVNILDDTLTNADINSAAGIDLSKLDDWSTDDAQQILTTDPGTSDSLTNATTMQIELTQLRLMLQELRVGVPDTGAVASSGGTAAFVSWADGPIRGGNLIYNGGFDSIETLAIGADGDGWTRVLTPTTLEAVNLTESEDQGDGKALNVIDTDDPLSGVSQTLNGLKGDTKYLATVTVKDVVGTCRIVTTGADTNDLSVTSDDSNTWQVLAGTFETIDDPSGTDVVVQLLAVAASDQCYFENVGVYEIGANPVAAGGVLITTGTTATEVDITSGAVPDLSAIDMTPPMPGCIIEVDAFISVGEAVAASPDIGVTCNIDEEGVNKGTVTMLAVEGGNAQIAATLVMKHTNTSPAAGADLTYTVECTDAPGADAAEFECGTDTCQLWVKMTCPTR
jgi:hypothetical protein